MTLSKKQLVIIWTFAMVILILVGLGYYVEYSGDYEIRRGQKYLTFYGITIAPDYTPTGKFLSWMNDVKYKIAIATAIISLTAIITAKKKYAKP
jgi:hypothetical protein